MAANTLTALGVKRLVQPGRYHHSCCRAVPCSAGVGRERARWAGASIEATLELWAASLREGKARMRPLFAQERMARSAGLFLDGLFGPERRETGWTRAEAAGDAGPWRQQAILGRGRWEADAPRDVARQYTLEVPADPGAVLVVVETGFLKQGTASCGVARRYTGSAGKITNCQIGVFAAYVPRRGHAFVDRALYLPKAWADDPARRAAAHVPQGVRFATKPRTALAMIERAIAAGAPFSWVAADTVYGVGEVELALRRTGKGYVLGVTGAHHVHSLGVLPTIVGTADEVAAELPPSAWRRLSAGEGTKGPRLHDWAYLQLAHLGADEYVAGAEGLWTRGQVERLRHAGLLDAGGAAPRPIRSAHAPPRCPRRTRAAARRRADGTTAPRLRRDPHGLQRSRWAIHRMFGYRKIAWRRQRRSARSERAAT